MNVPMRHPGTAAEKAANYRTHRFSTVGDPDDSETYCDDCGCKPWHVAAEWPCGTSPPRVETSERDGVLDQVTRVAAWTVNESMRRQG